MISLYVTCSVTIVIYSAVNRFYNAHAFLWLQHRKAVAVQSGHIEEASYQMLGSASEIHTSFGSASSSAPSSFCSNVTLHTRASRIARKNTTETRLHSGGSFCYLRDPFAALLVAVGEGEYTLVKPNKSSKIQPKLCNAFCNITWPAAGCPRANAPE